LGNSADPTICGKFTKIQQFVWWESGNVLWEAGKKRPKFLGIQQTIDDSFAGYAMDHECYSRTLSANYQVLVTDNS
jgi:hypothetical protein